MGASLAAVDGVELLSRRVLHSRSLSPPQLYRGVLLTHFGLPGARLPGVRLLRSSSQLHGTAAQRRPLLTPLCAAGNLPLPGWALVTPPRECGWSLVSPCWRNSPSPGSLGSGKRRALYRPPQSDRRWRLPPSPVPTTSLPGAVAPSTAAPGGQNPYLIAAGIADSLQAELGLIKARA